MLSSVFAAILSSLLHGSSADSTTLARASAAETAVRTAALAESPPALRDRDARIMFVVGYVEGDWYASPRGSSDAGRACGGAQVHVRFWSSLLDPRWTCAILRSDLTLGYRAGLRVIHALEKKCGSPGRALGAFRTGTCRESSVTHAMCLAAGIGESCEVKP